MPLPVPVGKDGWELGWRGEEAFLRRNREYLPMIPGLDRQYIMECAERGNLEALVMKTDWGLMEGETVNLKKGPFGLYVEWKGEKKPLPASMSYGDFHLGVAETLFSSSPGVDAPLPRERPSIHLLRALTPELSIRENKKTHRPYIFYKTMGMVKPQFYNLKGFPQNYKTCEKEELIQWIRQTYDVISYNIRNSFL
jgi:hypothetical protein